MPKKKKNLKIKAKSLARKSRKTNFAKAPVSAKAAEGNPSGFQWRERRLKDIPFVDRHPTPETAKKYNDTLPLPFGGEVKKDAMREHGLFH